MALGGEAGEAGNLALQLGCWMTRSPSPESGGRSDSHVIFERLPGNWRLFRGCKAPGGVGAALGRR